LSTQEVCFLLDSSRLSQAIIIEEAASTKQGWLIHHLLLFHVSPKSGLGNIPFASENYRPARGGKGYRSHLDQSNLANFSVKGQE
jgi:hypothetical protein